MHALHADDGVASEVNRPRFSRHIQGLLLADSCPLHGGATLSLDLNRRVGSENVEGCVPLQGVGR